MDKSVSNSGLGYLRRVLTFALLSLVLFPFFVDQAEAETRVLTITAVDDEVEVGENAQFSVTWDIPAEAGGFTAFVVSFGGTATNAVSVSYNVWQGQTSAIVTQPAIREGTVTATLIAYSGPPFSYSVGDPGSASVDVGPRTPVITIAPKSTSPVTEGMAAEFTVKANPAPTTPISVNVEVTQEGDFAQSGEIKTHTVNIDTNGTGSNLSITTDNDNIDEKNGAIIATVSSGTGYSPHNSNNVAQVTVNDNDATTVTLSRTNSGAIIENEGTADFTVSLGRALEVGETVTVPLSVSGSGVTPSDYSLSLKTGTNLNTGVGSLITSTPHSTAEPAIVFTGHATNVVQTATLTLTAQDDNVDEGVSETITIGFDSGNRAVTSNLDRISGSGTGGTTTSGSVSIEVTDDDQPPPETPIVSISGGSSVTEGGNASFSLMASPAPSSTISVNVEVTQEGDFAQSGEITTHSVDIGTNGEGSLSIKTDNDNTDEANGAITATVISGSGYSPNNNSNEAEVTVTDNDATTVTLSRTGTGAIAEDGGTADFTVTLGRALGSDETVTVPLAITGSGVSASDYSLSLKTGTNLNTGVGSLITSTPHSTAEPAIVFTGHATNVVQTATLTLTSDDDDIDEGASETITIGFDSGNRAVISNLDRASGTGTGGTTPSGTVSIVVTDNDDPPPPGTPIVSISGGSSVTEGGSASFSLTATPAPSSTISVNVEVTQEGDFAQSGEITTHSVDIGTNGEGSLSIKTDNDNTDEENGAIIATVTSGSGYSPNNNNVAEVTVTDDDNQVPNGPSETPQDNWQNPSPQAVKEGLVRFGRSLGEQSVQAIRDRIGANHQPGFTGKLAGHTLPTVVCDDTVQFLDIEKQTRPCVGSTNQNLHSEEVGITPKDIDNHSPEHSSQSITADELLSGTSFTLTGETDKRGTVVLWGQGTRSEFKSRSEDLTTKGELTGYILGLDWLDQNRLYGFMLWKSSGDVNLSGEGNNGNLNIDLTTLVPYAGWQTSNGVQVWGALGFGNGSLIKKPEEGDEVKSDIDWRMAALGVGGRLLQPELTFEGAELSWNADLLWTETQAAAVEDGFPALNGQTARQRLGLTSVWRHSLPSGGELRPSLEVSIRHDGGDAESGLGLEVGGGLEWLDPTSGWSVATKGRTLVVHDDNDFKDWSISVSLTYDPNPETKKGFSASLSHDRGGEESLLEAEQLPGIDDGSPKGNWQAEMAYGIDQGQGRVGSPYMAVKGKSEAEEARLGYRIEPDQDQPQTMSMDFWTEPEISRAQGPESSGHSVGVNLNTHW